MEVRDYCRLVPSELRTYSPHASWRRLVRTVVHYCYQERPWLRPDCTCETIDRIGNKERCYSLEQPKEYTHSLSLSRERSSLSFLTRLRRRLHNRRLDVGRSQGGSVCRAVSDDDGDRWRSGVENETFPWLRSNNDVYVDMVGNPCSHSCCPWNPECYILNFMGRSVVRLPASLTHPAPRRHDDVETVNQVMYNS